MTKDYKIAIEILAKYDKARKGFKEMEKVSKSSWQALKRDMDKLKPHLKKFWDSFGKWAKRGALVAIAAFAGISFKTVKMAGDFQKSLANISTLVDTTKVDMNKLGKGVLDMSVDVTKSTKDLTDGLYQVISAGVDTGSSLDVLRVSAKAATAGLSTTLTSVDAITTVLNAYGLGAEKAEYVSDLMFQTVKSGKVTYEELAGSLGNVISTASETDVSLEELFAAIATLTKGGVEARRATTYLNAVLMAVAKPSGDAEDAAAELGLEWSLSALEAKGFAGFIDDLKTATGGQIDQMVRFIPQIEALKAILPLTGKQAEQFTAAIDDMGAASGATEEAFKKQEEGLGRFNTQWEKLKLTIAKYIILIGEKLLHVISPLIEQLRKWVDTNKALIDQYAVELSKALKEVDWKEMANDVLTVSSNLAQLTKTAVDFALSVGKHWGNLKDIIKSTWSLIEPTFTPAGVYEKYGIPFEESYARGTNYVPKTGIYQLHQGEAVIPASQNQANTYDQRQDNRSYSAHYYGDQQGSRVEQEFEMQQMFRDMQRYDASLT